MSKTQFRTVIAATSVLAMLFCLSSISAYGQLTAIDNVVFCDHVTVEDVIESFGVPDSLHFHSQYWEKTGELVWSDLAFYKDECDRMLSETEPCNHNFQTVRFYYPDAEIMLATMHWFPGFESAEEEAAGEKKDEEESDEDILYDPELYYDYYDIESFFITREGSALRDTVNNVSIRIGDPFQKLVDYVENAPLLSYDYMTNSPGMKGYDIDRIHSEKISELKYSDWGSNEYGKSSGFYPGVFSDVSFTAYVKDGVITAFSYFDRGEL